MTEEEGKKKKLSKDFPNGGKKRKGQNLVEGKGGGKKKVILRDL